MNKIIDYFVERSLVVNLITFLIIVSGVYSLLHLNKETFPDVDFDFISISSIYPGAAAEEVEKLVSLEIERKIRGIDGIEEVNSLSMEGTSVVSVKVDPDTSMDEVYDEIRNELSDISKEVPDDVEAPVIKKASNSRNILEFAIFGKKEIELRKIAKQLQFNLERDSKISRVDFSNYRNEIIDIQVDLKKLNQFDLTLAEVFETVKDGDVDLSAGNVKKTDKEVLIRTLRESNNVEQIKDTVIRSNDSGNKVLLSDIATIERVFQDRTTNERANGEQAIYLKVFSKKSSDIIKSAKFAKKVVKDASKLSGFSYHEFQDLSFYVERRLSVLSKNGIQGIFLVLICLIFFMNMRVSIITALGAPFAFLVAFTLMESFGITVNLISMFGLILVLGMLVDDSIIVSEQYYQYLEEGEEPKAAAKRAAKETVAPVTSTILTTMIAFGSLFFMDGIMGKFLWPVPAVIIICLIASWLECFLILPGHLADFAPKLKSAAKERWYQPLMLWYEKVLTYAIKYAKTTVFLFFIVFAGAVALASKMRFELFPSDDATYVYVHVKGEVGTPLVKTNQKLIEIEKVILEELKKDEYKGVRTIAGVSWNKTGTKTGKHYGSIFLELTMQDLRERKTNDLVSLISKRVVLLKENFEINIDKIKNGPPTGKPISIDFYGENFEQIKLAAMDIQKVIEKESGVLSTETDFEDGKDQIVLKIKEAEARRLGVNNLQIAREVRNSYEGMIARTIKESDDDVEVIIRLDEDYRKRSLETLNNIKILNKYGQKIRLQDVVEIERRSGAFVIRRLNGKRVITLSGEVDPEIQTARALNQKLIKTMPSLMQDHSDISYEVKGENKDTTESLDSFKRALVISSLIILMILVVQFSSFIQPLIIMSAIPLGFIGVILAFSVFDLALGFMALMGVLGLVGVVVNDSIVLVTVINRYIAKEGRSTLSIIKATVSRFRPVILTTFTTVAGLLPIAHATGGDPFLKPMAVSFAYGLLFSTLLTLFFVPCCFQVYVSAMKKLGR